MLPAIARDKADILTASAQELIEISAATKPGHDDPRHVLRWRAISIVTATLGMHFTSSGHQLSAAHGIEAEKAYS
jgi:hypothetical protein